MKRNLEFREWARGEHSIAGAVGAPLETAASVARHPETGGRETMPECRKGSKGCGRCHGTHTSCLAGRADEVRAGRHRKMTGEGR